MVSEEGTGYYYTTNKPNKWLGAASKLRLKKYDPVIMKHCWFKESKKMK